MMDKVVPTIVHERLSWALDGLKTYDRVIDTDKIKDIKGSITSEDITKSMTTLSSKDPAILIVGDVSLSEEWFKETSSSTIAKE